MRARALSREVCTIVLAAGEGMRLRDLTRALHGEDLPKQFARIQRCGSLLQRTLSRARAWSRPEHTFVVVAAERADIARRQLPPGNAPEIVLQPRNVGTAAGILLPLARVLERSPDAQVVILPSDHYVRDEAAFARSIRNALASARVSQRISLVGAVPEHAETQYGWIATAPGARSSSLRITSFVEKPEAALAATLFSQGALWNTFIMAGAARTFEALAGRHLPFEASLFDRYRQAIGGPLERCSLAELYERLEPSDFSRDVLQASSDLCAVRLSPCGWSDWGTPERVLASLDGTSELLPLLRRLERSPHATALRHLLASSMRGSSVAPVTAPS
ncbi:MAG: sugar phosphate nucleotidyltransferase [Polyangiaceae bacterium]